jgi:hypothetical protein
MAGLTNSNGNYMVVNHVSPTYVEIAIYETKAKKDVFDAGTQTPFDKIISSNLNLGEDLELTLKATTATVAGGESIFDNMIMVTETLIIEQSAIDPNRHKPNGILGDWGPYVES